MLMIYIIAILLGLAIGSFLNVVIFRLPEEKSLIKIRRSVCRFCNKFLKIAELIPVVSFVVQKGKCLGCKKKISWQYPIIEIITVLFFVIEVWYRLNPTLNNLGHDMILIARDLVFICTLIVIFMIDVKHLLIFDRTIYPAMVIVFILNFIASGFDNNILWRMILAGCIGYLFFALQYYGSRKKWVGGGDMKLAALIGVALGVSGILLTLFIAYVGGEIIALCLVWMRKKQMNSQLPMGAFLAPAAIIVLFFGTQILDWYWGFLW